MSVSTFDPARDPANDSAGDPGHIRVTEAARTHIQAQIARSGRNCLRLGVKESGCNGYMYTLDFIDAPSDDDRMLDLGDSVRLYVTARDLRMVRGTEIDYVTEGLNASLKFKNPNAESQCGCGESFALSGTA